MVRELDHLAQRFEDSKLFAAANRLRRLGEDLAIDGLIVDTLETEEDIYHHPAFTYFPKRRMIEIGGRDVDLTPLEKKFIDRLVLTPNQVVSNDQAIKAVWGDKEYTKNNLDTLSSRLRNKLEPGNDGSKFPYLKTVRGVGYRLSDPSKR